MLSTKKLVIYSLVLILITSVMTSICITYRYKDYLKLIIATKSIQKNFYKDTDNEELMDNALKGLFEATEDEYSEYYTENEFKRLIEAVSGKIVGIGAVLKKDTDNNIVTIESVVKDSPASTVGLKSGDQIIKVDGKSIYNKNLETTIDSIKGKEGTLVKITVKRDDKEIDFDIIRKEIILDSIEYKILESDIGYISILSFDESTYIDFKKALDELKSKNIKGLIVDVRDNSGGLLTVCDDISDEILDEGQVIVSTKRKNKKIKERISDNNRQLDIPIVVLINENSASASEIFAAAVVDNNKGIAVGTKTFGKGLVQTVMPFVDGSGFKLTIAQYYTPNGEFIHKKGIKPTIEEKDEEKQLDVAVDWLKKEIKKNK